MASILKQFGSWVRITRAKDAEFKAFEAACAADHYIVHSTDTAFDMFRRSYAAACLRYNRDVYDTRLRALEPQ
jgi:hypothetical protein